MVSKILVFALFVGIASAAVSRKQLPEMPEEFAGLKGCYIEEVDAVISFGSTISPIGYCYSISCSETEIQQFSCGAIGNADPNCYITEEDLSKAYPNCCPHIECPKSIKKCKKNDN